MGLPAVANTVIPGVVQVAVNGAFCFTATAPHPGIRFPFTVNATVPVGGVLPLSVTVSVNVTDWLTWDVPLGEVVKAVCVRFCTICSCGDSVAAGLLV